VSFVVLSLLAFILFDEKMSTMSELVCMHISRHVSLKRTYIICCMIYVV